jgi:hypothetical protein
MNVVTNVVRNLIKKEQVLPLGRWNLEYCSKKINQKIDYSNEDHSGPYTKKYIKVNNNLNIVKNKTKYSHDKIQSDNFMSILEIYHPL